MTHKTHRSRTWSLRISGSSKEAARNPTRSSATLSSICVDKRTYGVRTVSEHAHFPTRKLRINLVVRKDLGQLEGVLRKGAVGIGIPLLLATKGMTVSQLPVELQIWTDRADGAAHWTRRESQSSASTRGSDCGKISLSEMSSWSTKRKPELTRSSKRNRSEARDTRLIPPPIPA